MVGEPAHLKRETSAKSFGCRKQLALGHRDLSIDHAVKVQFTATSESQVLRRVRECCRMGRILNRRHEHEQCGRSGSRLVTSATDNLSQRFDLFIDQIIRVRFERFGEVERLDNRFARFGSADESSEPRIVDLQSVAKNSTSLGIERFVI